MVRRRLRLWLIVSLLAFSPLTVFANSTAPCPRPAPGSVVTPPPELFSRNGVLNVVFNYFTSMDAQGRTLFCFVTSDGLESPTLHVNPGDTINITLTNQVPAIPGGRAMVQSGGADVGIMRYIQGARILHFDGELSFVRACNAALHYVTGDNVLFLGVETELLPNAIAAALRRLTSDQRLGAVGAKLIRGHGRGLSGGTEVWGEISKFFAALKRRAGYQPEGAHA